ncbi:perforin-1-like isoform X2 [Leucoraja erinacea]|uniref:perforin-1-like isoform X2 n=1 Tax=Leucoraja erinaceus TaxID=7782 RepID=UPI00245464CD|nr:perforin-1-like isoform X2 [Leucoraja erinacea]
MAARCWCPPLVLISLLLLAPRAASSVCGTGTANECKAATPMPGVEKVGEGFDVVHMRGTGTWVVDTRSWQLRGGGCTLCHNDQLGGKRQRLPQAVEHWQSATDCRRHLSGQTYDSAEEVSKSESSGLDSSWSSHLDVEHKDMSAAVSAAGSLSQQAEFARQKASSDRYSFSRLSFSCRLYKARLGHQPPLHPHLQKRLHNLPRTGGTSEANLLYSDFLHTFGTHYVVAVDLGGSYTDLTALRTCQIALNGQTLEEVKDCLEAEVQLKMAGKVDSGAKWQQCRQDRSKMEGKLTFHQTYSERLTTVTGGSLGSMDNLFNPSSSSDSFYFYSNSSLSTSSPSSDSFSSSPSSDESISPSPSISSSFLSFFLPSSISNPPSKDSLPSSDDSSDSDSPSNSKHSSSNSLPSSSNNSLPFSDSFFASSSPGGSSAYTSWLSSLPAHPGVLHRKLEPLHLLLPSNDPRRGLLKAAISRHILKAGEKAMMNQCRGVGTEPCPAGGKPDPSRPCSCRCQGQPGVSADCCPRRRRWGALQVEVQRARGLWGDHFTRTDAYVRLRVGPAGATASTAVVWNNNNPVWGVTLHLGQVSLVHGPHGDTVLTVQVWDRDSGWDDDLLGSCQEVAADGRLQQTPPRVVGGQEQVERLQFAVQHPRVRGQRGQPGGVGRRAAGGRGGEEGVGERPSIKLNPTLLTWKRHREDL